MPVQLQVPEQGPQVVLVEGIAGVYCNCGRALQVVGVELGFSRRRLLVAMVVVVVVGV